MEKELDLQGMKKRWAEDLQGLLQASAGEAWTPALGLAIGGLRTAIGGVEAALRKASSTPRREDAKAPGGAPKGI